MCQICGLPTDHREELALIKNAAQVLWLVVLVLTVWWLGTTASLRASLAKRLVRVMRQYRDD